MILLHQVILEQWVKPSGCCIISLEVMHLLTTSTMKVRAHVKKHPCDAVSGGIFKRVLKS